jgi:hypothetical protein
MNKVKVPKIPDKLLQISESANYQALTQSELLTKVKLLHNQLLKTNEYLLEVHRLSIYNWDSTDKGNIIVELHDNKKGFLLDNVLRIRGIWDPSTNTPELQSKDEGKIGWLYRVGTEEPFTLYDTIWKAGDYALYDEKGFLYNVTSDMLKSMFTPIIPITTDSIETNIISQGPEGIMLSSRVKIDPTANNDLSVNARGLYSNAYEKSKGLISISYTAPTKDNDEGGLRIVYLEELPNRFYNGWLYLVPPKNITVIHDIDTDFFTKDIEENVFSYGTSSYVYFRYMLNVTNIENPDKLLSEGYTTMEYFGGIFTHSINTLKSSGVISILHDPSNENFSSNLSSEGGVSYTV